MGLAEKQTILNLKEATKGATAKLRKFSSVDAEISFDEPSFEQFFIEH